VIDIYNNIDDVSENQTFGFLSQGTYVFTGGGYPTTIPGLLDRCSRPLAVVSFIDVASGSGSDNGSWIKNLTDSLKALYDKYSSTALVVGVFFRYPTTSYPYGQLNAATCLPFLTGSEGYFLAYNANYLDNGAIIAGPAARFKSGVSSSSVSFYSYVVECSTGRILDKFHRSSVYNGEDAYNPKADLLHLGWTDATNATMYEYLDTRIGEYLSTPSTVTILPKQADKLLNSGTPLKITTGSKLEFSYSQKALHSTVGNQHIFLNGATVVNSVIANASDYDVPWITYRDAPINQKEKLTRVVASPTADVTLALQTPNTGLINPRATGFSGAYSCVFHAAGDTATCEVSVYDGATTVIVGDLSTVPVCNNATRTLTVRVLTEYPTPEQPTGRIMMPDDSAHELTFVNYAATVDQTVLVADGVYTVVVDAFVNNAGNEMAQAVRRFMVATETDVEAASVVDAIEGWGYFSRDEGGPSTVAGPLPIAGDSGWIAEGTIMPNGGTISEPLSIPATAGLYRSYRRTYSSLFGSAGNFLEPGRANYYVEGCFRILSHSGAVKAVKDENGGDLSLYVIGVGLEVWDGPFHAKLCVVQPAAGIEQLAFMTATSLASGEERYRLTGLTVPNGSLQLVRLSFNPASGDVTLARGSVASGASPTGPIALTETFNLPRKSLASDNDTFLGSGVRFGVLSVANQAVTCEWEFTRYGFLDSAYSARLGETNTLGFAHTQSADAAADYRSRDLLFGADLSVDPVPDASNTLTASLSGPGAIPVAAGIPYTLRFYSVDWDDAAGEGSPDGFAKANFPACYQTTGVAAPGYAGLTTGAFARGRRSVAGLFSATATWDFDLEQTRLARRLLVCAYVDSPLFPAPAFIAGMPLSAMIVDDAPAKDDYRCAVRQFLPDFYVRDYFGDQGLSTLGGCMSPDMAIGVFLGPYDGLVSSPTPHGLRLAADPTQDPDPRAIEDGNVSYPSGFALGQPHASPTDMTPAELAYSTTGGIPIRAVSEDGSVSSITVLDSAWSDNANQCYYNRMWVRVSNRGIVPGPAVVQVFFLGSTLRSAFDVSLARVSNYQKIFSNKGRTYFAQSAFQQYSSLGSMPVTVYAVPALSGASTRDVSTTTPQNFVLAEFVWHFGSGEVPATSAESHGCRAACINVAKASPPPADLDPWTTGIDSVPPPAVGSIWDINKATNNISVRNSNVVIGEAMPATPPVNLKCKVDEHGEPADYRPLPNTFRMTFEKAPTIHGLIVDASAFPGGDTILRLDADFCARARFTGMRELSAEILKGDTYKHFLYVKDEVKAASKYRYFLIDAGRMGSINVLGAVREKSREALPPRLARLYFRIHADAKPGPSKIVLSQTAGGVVVGSYSTTVIVSPAKDIRFIADARTGIIYDVRDYPAARDAIPYGKRSEFTGPGLAVQEGFKFGPEKAIEFMTGKLKNDLVQVPKGYVFPKQPQVMEALPDGLAGGIVGQVVDQFGIGLEGVEIEIHDVAHGLDLGTFMTDFSGRYLARIPAGAETIPLRGKKPKYLITVKASALARPRKGKARDRIVKARKRLLSAPKDGCIAIKTVIRR